MDGDTQTDRKSRLAEMAKAIKAKKADISKSLEKVNSEVKKSLAVQETSVRRTRTVLEEVSRQVIEEQAGTREVEEVRAKSGVIRRRVKEGAAPAPAAAPRVAKSVPDEVEESPRAPAERPAVKQPAEARGTPVRAKVEREDDGGDDDQGARGAAPSSPKGVREAEALAKPAASKPGLIRRGGKDVTPEALVAKPAAARPTSPLQEDSTESERTVETPVVRRAEQPAVSARGASAPADADTKEIAVRGNIEAAGARETESTLADSEVSSDDSAGMMAALEATASGGISPVALIKRAGKDVTPVGLTFTPNQTRPVGPPRPGGSEAPERGVAVPGTARPATGPGAKRGVFELKEMTFGPGQLHGGRRKRVIPKKSQQKTQITTPKAIKRKIAIEGGITVGALASRMSVKVGDVMKKLMSMGMMATMNQSIDADTASLLAAEFGFEISNVEFKEEELLGGEVAEDEALLEPRAPVVTIMGHVDHGKTSLLDSIRKANVAAGEAGGITQHIGAYRVKLDDKYITFLDTPGHEAFSAMRSRGAKVTDIVVIVVGVDDGPQPQTLEAIAHAKAADVPIIVALNKIDKPGTDPDKVMQSLTQHGLVPEAWGGDTMFVKTSAKTGIGVKELLEAILLRAEVDEFRANPAKPAIGTIIEAKIDKGRGPVVTVLVQEGTLRVGDAVVSGAFYGKVRALADDKGKPVKEAGPSTPVEVLGLSGVPDAGDSLHVAADVDAAKQVAEHRTTKARDMNLGGGRKIASMDNLFGGISSTKELNIIVKADVQGSVEALKSSLEKMSTEKVTVKVVHGSVGAVTENDVLLATASKAMIVGFNVKPDGRGREMAEQERIVVRSYSIIYEALDEVREAMVALLEPIYKEVPLGKAEVRNLFSSSKVGAVAGCMVVEGKIKRNAKVRVIRGNKVVFDGKIQSLKRFKDDAGEVVEGFECGLSVEGYGDVMVGDEISCYAVEQYAATL